MSILNIITIGDPILREPCMTVRKFNDNLAHLLDNMAQTMRENDGVGLAAPQIGIPKRVVVIDAGQGLVELVNPELIASSGQQTGQEGCLSVPGKYADVSRPAQVKVRAQKRDGSTFEIEGEELLARALVHEIDHLNGILFVDRMEKTAE